MTKLGPQAMATPPGAVGAGAVGGVGPGGAGPKAPGTDSAIGAQFREALSNAAAAGALGSPAVAAAAQSASVSGLKFSGHAVERMRSRGISFSPDEMKGIEGAVERAAQKGSKDTLVLTGQNALIVSVKNQTVVTVMDKNAMKDNVFTNIDSTVVI